MKETTQTLNNNIIQQVSDTFQLGALLAIVGGYLDAYSYISRNKVFANAQTGNIVLLGIKLIDGNHSEIFNYLISIFAYAIGVIIAQVIRGQFQYITSIHWRQIVLFIEIIVLLTAGFIPCGTFNVVATTFISFVCALQAESFRKLKGNAFSTTMCTGNLRSGTECLYQYITNHNNQMKTKFLHYYGIILFFIIGACLGTLITRTLMAHSVWICCILLIIGIISMSKKIPNKNN